MDDKRTSSRVPTNIEIVFRESGSFIKSYMINVSRGGVFIKTGHPLPLESELSLKIQLPGDTEKIAIQGKVVWTNSHSKAFPVGMGIQFTDIAPEHKEKIDAFVEAHLEQIKKHSIL